MNHQIHGLFIFFHSIQKLRFHTPAGGSWSDVMSLPTWRLSMLTKEKTAIQDPKQGPFDPGSLLILFAPQSSLKGSRKMDNYSTFRPSINFYSLAHPKKINACWIFQPSGPPFFLWEPPKKFFQKPRCQEFLILHLLRIMWLIGAWIDCDR